MKRISKNKSDELWLRALGQKIEGVIKAKGHESLYQFWLEKAGDHISRSSLNYLINGQIDPKITTLRVLAKLLNCEIKDLLP